MRKSFLLSLQANTALAKYTVTCDSCPVLANHTVMHDSPRIGTKYGNDEHTASSSS